VKVLSWTNTTGATNSPRYTIDPLNYTNANGSRQTNTGWYEVTLLPMELNSDLNNDGEIDGADSALRDAVYKSGASADDIEKGTEYLFVNDAMSNGLWDKDDPNKPSGTTDDDDIQELKVTLSPNFGAAWFEHPAIDKLEFYKTKACAAGDKITFPWNLSNNNPLPGKIYVRTLNDVAAQVEGDLVLKFGKEDKSQTFAEVKLKFTVVKQLGDSKYFKAARDYILENNTKLFAHQRDYSGTVFRIVCMREEATSMSAIDTSRTSPVLKGIDAVKSANASSTVIINGNQCFFADDRNKLFASLARDITDKCHGRIVRGGTLDAAVSSDNTDKTTSPKGSDLAGVEGNYIAQNGNTFQFALGRVPQGSQSAKGGLSTFYASPKRVDREHQMIGYGPGIEQGKGIVFTATQTSGVGKAPEFSADAKNSGVKNLSGSGVDRFELLILDGSSSVALVYENASGVQQKIVAGAKHGGPEYYINTYLLFNCAKPR